MSVDITCGSCQRKMRVPDTAAGKRIKCPKCQALIDVPGAGGIPVGVAVEMWHLKTEDGQIYGPVSRADLDLWQAEGRLNLESQVLRAGSDQWQWATDLYPQLAASTTATVPMGVAAGPYSAAANAAAAPAAQANPFDFTGGSATASPSTSENPFDFTSRGSASRSGGGSSYSAGSKLSDKKKIVAGLLGIFLGGYGVHNFYLGYTNKGILQLILLLPTCGLSGIWGFAEGIMILTGSINRDARGRRLRD